MDQAAKKAALRRRLRQMREQQDPVRLRTDSEAACGHLLELPDFLSANRIFCYMSCFGEVETRPLLEELLSRKKTLLVPRCGAGGQMDCVPIDSFAGLRPGAYGILEPEAGLPAAPWEDVDFAVVPAMACGEDGTRLGQGGGYYDRFLQKTRCPSAALCLEAFILDDLPREEHDRRVNWVVTQRRIWSGERL